MSKTIPDDGWSAVPRSLEKLLSTRRNTHSKAAPLKVEDIPLPSSPVVESVTKHARENLNEKTFNHSMRVYYYGIN